MIFLATNVYNNSISFAYYIINLTKSFQFACVVDLGSCHRSSKAARFRFSEEINPFKNRTKSDLTMQDAARLSQLPILKYLIAWRHGLYIFLHGKVVRQKYLIDRRHHRGSVVYKMVYCIQMERKSLIGCRHLKTQKNMTKMNLRFRIEYACTLQKRQCQRKWSTAAAR